MVGTSTSYTCISDFCQLSYSICSDISVSYSQYLVFVLPMTNKCIDLRTSFDCFFHFPYFWIRTQFILTPKLIIDLIRFFLALYCVVLIILCSRPIQINFFTEVTSVSILVYSSKNLVCQQTLRTITSIK